MVTVSSVLLIGLLVVVPACLMHFAIKQEQKWLDEIDERIEELLEENEGDCCGCGCCHCKGDDNDEE